jgi:hypothetical protein
VFCSIFRDIKFHKDKCVSQVKAFFNLLFFGRFGNINNQRGGDGVPLITARAGLMTPILQASVAVGSLKCDQKTRFKAGLFLFVPVRAQKVFQKGTFYI